MLITNWGTLHERFLSLQPMFAPKRFEFSPCWVDIQKVSMLSDFYLRHMPQKYKRMALAMKKLWYTASREPSGTPLSPPISTPVCSLVVGFARSVRLSLPASARPPYTSELSLVLTRGRFSFLHLIPRRCCSSSLFAFNVGTNGLARGFSGSCAVNERHIGCAAS